MNQSKITDTGNRSLTANSKASDDDDVTKKTDVKSATVWEVRIYPAVNSIQGHFMPKKLHPHKERRISVEVRKRIKPDDDIVSAEKKAESKNNPLATRSGLNLDEFCILRIFTPLVKKDAKQALDVTPSKTKEMAAEPSKKAHVVEKSTSESGLNAGKNSLEAASKREQIEESTPRIHNVSNRNLSIKNMTDVASSNSVFPFELNDDANEDNSVSTLGIDGVDDGSTCSNALTSPTNALDSNGAIDSEWVEKYNIPLSNLLINKRVKNICVITAPFQKKKKTREIVFWNEKDALAFDNLIKREKKNEAERQRKSLKMALGGKRIKPDEKINILVEIVSAWDILIGDFSSSDPYVVVRMGDKELHRTKYIPNTLDPIWSVNTGSLFILTTTCEELFKCYEGIEFQLKDYDKYGKNESLGRVMVPPKKLYDGGSVRLEFDIKPMPGKKKAKGKLAIRARHATPADLEFMFELERKEGQIDVLKYMKPPSQPKGLDKRLSSILSRNTRIDAVDHHKKYRVRPYPDPRRKIDTQWMTEQAIESEITDKSQQWFEAGSGHLGRVYLEILACDGLPNKDIMVAGKVSTMMNKTDAFVTAVYEDCIVKSDVIDDCLSPRWLPWTRRAFVFHMQHPSSPIYLAAFDFDPGFDHHDPIGRVTVDLLNLTPNTEYVMYYKLYSSSRVTKRKEDGTVVIRLRVELEDERQVLLSNLGIPPDTYINCKRKKDFYLAKYACEGKYDMHSYSYSTMSTYLEELSDWQIVWFFVKKALANLFLWRSHVSWPIPIPCFPPVEQENGTKRYIRLVSFLFPIHSYLAFIVGLILVERPSLYPSFFMGCIAWTMLAVMQYRMAIPSALHHCKSFQQILLILIFGHSFTRPCTINSCENEDEYNEFYNDLSSKIDAVRKDAEYRAEEKLRLQEEYEQNMEEIGDQTLDITTQKKTISFDPMKSTLYPYQVTLAWICDILRISKNIIIWEECYYSFIITLGSLVLSILFLFLPWPWILKWTARLLVWVSLGPWMKLADVFYFSTLVNLTYEERREQEESARKARKLVTNETARQARIQREDMIKLKEMKKYKFGKYIVKVPVVRVDRYRDLPLLQSYCKPYEDETCGTIGSRAMQEAGKDRVRILGQSLVGDMIPKPLTPPATEAPLGQPTARPWASKDEVNESTFLSSDSNIAAYAKVLASVVVAGIITWLGVPLMVFTVQLVVRGDFLSF